MYKYTVKGDTMQFTVYLTTNKINGKKYIGKHITNNPNDEYLGSGKLLLQAVKRYGKENFDKKVLFVYDNNDEMVAKERELVTEEIANSRDYYNMTPGGIGGMYGQRQSKKQKEIVRKAMMGKNKPKEQIERQRLSILKTLSQEGYVHPNTGKIRTPEQRKNISDNHADVSGDKNPMYGKTHSEETKAKIRQRALTRDKVQCQYCGKITSKQNNIRWHDYNCKERLKYDARKID